MSVVLGVVFVILLVVVGVFRLRRPAAVHASAPQEAAIHPPAPPADLFLDSQHVWVRLAADGTLRVGIDELLGELLGTVDRVELLSAVGTRVDRGGPLLVLHRGAPAGGELAGINDLLADNPQVLVDDPYGLGWVAAVRPRDHKEALAPLHVGNGAAGLLRARLERIVDFLVQRAAGTGARPLLADGGVPRRGALAELDDEGWRAFQERFLS
jgi:glycine cleavage system H protein